MTILNLNDSVEKWLILKNPIIKIPETSSLSPKTQEATNNIREQIINLIKKSEDQEGIDTEKVIMELKTIQPDKINQEIISLLEDGAIYEPRPGRVRYLG